MQMNEARHGASEWVQRAARNVASMIVSPANPTGDLAIPVETGDNHVEDHFRRAACSFRTRRSRAGRWPSQDHASADRQERTGEERSGEERTGEDEDH